MCLQWRLFIVSIHIFQTLLQYNSDNRAKNMNMLDVHYSLSQEHDWKIKLMLLMQYVIQVEEEEAVISTTIPLSSPLCCLFHLLRAPARGYVGG